MADPPSPSGAPLSRRQFLAATVAAAVAASCRGDDEPTAEPTTGASPTAEARPPEATATPAEIPTPTPQGPPVTDLTTNPFGLGVASGDPTQESVILWTRLEPEPLAPGSIDGATDHDLLWEIATDDTFTDLVDSGVVTALGALGHSVHVDAAGLAPDTWYSYRFRIGEFTSPAGRTRTMPGPDSTTPGRFGVSSCQNYEAGYYGAHRHAAADELDLFIWLGDYIYEYGPGEFPLEGPTGDVRVHNAPEVETVQDYRNRYALYKSDPDLQSNHHARPWLIVWDDHEVDNDYAGSISQDDDPIDAFSTRRAAAYQAWYEHMPVRLDPPDGPDYRIHRAAQWGSLVDFFMLDGRQYRDDQPVDGEFIPLPGLENADLPLRTLGPTALDPEHRFLGVEQEAWLLGELAASNSTWRVLAQQVIMHGISILPGQDPPLVTTDTWDGYYGNRKAILETLASQGIDNLVVLTGDFHSASVGDVKPDPFELESPVVATEFMATSISSQFPEAASDAAPLILATNAQIKFFDPRKGYTRCEVDAESFTAVYRAVSDPTDPDTLIEDIGTFVVTSGVPGAQPL